MANPRRGSLHFHTPSPPLPSFSSSSAAATAAADTTQSSAFLSFSSLLVFLKRPHAFPFLLFLFLILTWLFLRLQRPPYPPPFSSSSFSKSRVQEDKRADADANLARFSALGFPSEIAADQRGWLLNPVHAARRAGIRGGAQRCASVHVGEIRPGGIRGNHRHHTCNETFIIWGAKTKFRLENTQVEGKGYAEVGISEDEVAVAASPSGTAHALINVDNVQSTFFLGCQDSLVDYNSSSTDFKVWKDL